MILEGAYELRTARECRRLKEKEKSSFQKLCEALEGCQAALENRSGQTTEDALRKMERAKEEYEAAKTELGRAFQTIMIFVLDALENVEEAEENI